ncbi:MAG: phospholipase D-like domain-containing protein [Pseudomonadota bacterium]
MPDLSHPDLSHPDLLEPGHNCWRIETANRFGVIVDAEQYFLAARNAMLQARKSIMMVGWDFDARIRLAPTDSGCAAPDRLGDFVIWLVDRQPQLHVRLLQWNSGTFRNLFRGTNAWHLLRWKLHDRITARMDSTHPPFASHHQKLLVIDDSIAFCGGIDMTMKRWDTRAHADVQPGRVSPYGGQLQPWHDLVSIFDGDAARAMGDLCRQRWQHACGEALAPVTAPVTVAPVTGRPTVAQTVPQTVPPVDWPGTVTPLAAPARIGIARSLPDMAGQTPVQEIEALYIDMIASAQTLIFAECQYFASRRIAAALARRLEQAQGPEVVIIGPAQSEGWLEPIAMDTARARLVASLGRHNPHGRLAIYHPVTATRKPIYVHSKLMIVDDRLLRVGSSNLNNRSMRLDSECDVVLDAAQDSTGAIARNLRHLRHDMLAEHLGCTIPEVEAAVARNGSLVRAIEALRGAGRSLVPYDSPNLSALETWLADNEILDPDGPDEMFEALSKRGLFRGRLRKPRD